MERRKHPRFATNLKAVLVHDQAMPIGCRVRDVSAGGMLLQYEHYNNAGTFEEGGRVEIRLSLKQDNNRATIPLPMTIRRVEENGIGTEFIRPQEQLISLLEPYLLDREATQSTAVVHEQLTAIGANNTRSPPSSPNPRAERRRYAIKRARAQMSESLQSRHEPRLEKTPTEKAVVKNGDRKLFYIGLLSLTAAIGIALLDFNDRYQEESRFRELSTEVNQQANLLDSLRGRIVQPAPDKQALAEIQARMDSLETSFASLEARITQTAGEIAGPVITDTPAIPGPPANNAKSDTKQSAPLDKVAATGHGAWVINFVSLDDEASANLFTKKARAHGIPVDINQVTVKGQKVWRVQLDGFETRKEASAYAEKSRPLIGLDKLWIYRKTPAP